MDTERSQPLDYQSPTPSAVPTTEARRAALGLLLATVLWGCGFTWAKAAGDAVHRAIGLDAGSAFGPIFVLGWRFTLAAAVVLLLVPPARRGWTGRGVLRVIGVGVLLAVGLILQHLGLDLTTEAVSAFLTSLTILFVPLILTLVLRRPPAPVMWVGVVLATVGVWLMTGAAPTGFGVGEALGLACALAFSLYILAVNAAAKTEGAWRMSAGQFLVVGLLCFVTSALVPGGHHMRPAATVGVLTGSPDVWLNILLLTTFPTLGAFSLLNLYQPKLDATRAALIYLVEPVIAAVYAWLMVGRRLDPMTIVGALLILAANVLVEMLSARARTAMTRDVEAPIVQV